MRTYEIYNTGDQVWFGERYGQEAVVKIVTHDGLVWEEGSSLTRLTGVERVIHIATVFCLKLIHRVLRA